MKVKYIAEYKKYLITNDDGSKGRTKCNRNELTKEEKECYEATKNENNIEIEEYPTEMEEDEFITKEVKNHFIKKEKIIFILALSAIILALIFGILSIQRPEKEIEQTKIKSKIEQLTNNIQEAEQYISEELEQQKALRIAKDEINTQLGESIERVKQYNQMINENKFKRLDESNNLVIE